MIRQAFDQSVSQMNAANSEDPNIEIADGKEWPKELLYSRRMSEMLECYKINACGVPFLFLHGIFLSCPMRLASDYDYSADRLHHL